MSKRSKHPRLSSLSLRRRYAHNPLLEALERRTLLSAPTQFISRGVGGGGAFFGPSFSPFNANDIYTSSDMSGVYHTMDLGQSWSLSDFRNIQGGRSSQIQFTSDPNVLYTIDTNDASGAVAPVKSGDGGQSWSKLTGWSPGDPVYSVYADPQNTNESSHQIIRLFISRTTGARLSRPSTAPPRDKAASSRGHFSMVGISMSGQIRGCSSQRTEEPHSMYQLSAACPLDLRCSR